MANFAIVLYVALLFGFPDPLFRFGWYLDGSFVEDIYRSATRPYNSASLLIAGPEFTPDVL